MALTKKLSLLCMSILTAGFVAESDAMNFKSDSMNFMGTGTALREKTTSIYKNNYEKLSSKNKNSIFGKPFKELSELPASNSLLTFGDILDVVDEAKTNANNNNYKYNVSFQTFKQKKLISNIKRTLQKIDLGGHEVQFMNRVSEIMKKYGVVVDWNITNQSSKPKFTINQFSKDLLSSFTSGDADNSTGVDSVYNNLIQMYTSKQQANNNEFSEYIMQFMILNMNVEQKWKLFKLCQQTLTAKKHHPFINLLMLHLMYQLSGILSYDVLQDNASELTDKIVLEAIRLQRAISKSNDTHYISIYRGLHGIIESIPNVNAMQGKIKSNIIEYNMTPRMVAPLFGTTCVESKLLDLLYCQCGVEKIESDNTNYNYYFKNQVSTNEIHTAKNQAMNMLQNILFGNNNIFEYMEYTIFGNIALDKQKNRRSVRRFSRIKNDVDSIRINLPYRKPLPVGNIVKFGTKTKPVSVVNLQMLEAIITNELNNESNKPTNNQQTIELLEKLDSAGNSKFYDIFRTLVAPSSSDEKNVSTMLQKQITVHNKEQVLAPSRNLELNKVEETGNFLESISNHLQKNQNAVQLLLTCDMYDSFKNAYRLKGSSNIKLQHYVITSLAAKRAAASTKVHYICIDRDDIANILANVYSHTNSSSRSKFLNCFKLLPAFYLNYLFKYIIDNECALTINDLYSQLGELIMGSVENRQYFAAISLQQSLLLLTSRLNNKLHNVYLVNDLVGCMESIIQTKLGDILNNMTGFVYAIEQSDNIQSQSQAILKLVAKYNQISSFTYNPMEILGDVKNVIDVIIQNVNNNTYAINSNIKKSIQECINSVYSQDLCQYMLVRELVPCVLQVALNNMLETFVYNKDGTINLADVWYYWNNNDSTATTKDLITNILDSDPYLRFIIRESVEAVRTLNEECNGIYSDILNQLTSQQQPFSSKTIPNIIDAINNVVSKYSVDLSVANISDISAILSSFAKHNSGILESLDGLGFYCLVKYIDQRIASRNLDYNVGKEKLSYCDYYRVQLIYSIWQITNNIRQKENSQYSLEYSVTEQFLTNMLQLHASGGDKQLLLLSNLTQNSNTLLDNDNYSQSYATNQHDYMDVMRTNLQNNNPPLNISNNQNMLKNSLNQQNSVNQDQIQQSLEYNDNKSLRSVGNPLYPTSSNPNMPKNPINEGMPDLQKNIQKINYLQARLQELNNMKTNAMEREDHIELENLIMQITKEIDVLKNQIPNSIRYKSLRNDLEGPTISNMSISDNPNNFPNNNNDLNNENRNVNNRNNNEYNNKNNDQNNRNRLNEDNRIINTNNRNEDDYEYGYNPMSDTQSLMSSFNVGLRE